MPLENKLVRGQILWGAKLVGWQILQRAMNDFAIGYNEVSKRDRRKVLSAVSSDN